LARYYSMADVTVLTSKKETYSMVTVESLCCGTPVIGFKAGGPEQIAILEYCRFCEHGDIQTVVCKMRSFQEQPLDVVLSDIMSERYERKKW